MEGLLSTRRVVRPDIEWQLSTGRSTVPQEEVGEKPALCVRRDGTQVSAAHCVHYSANCAARGRQLNWSTSPELWAAEDSRRASETVSSRSSDDSASPLE